MSGKTNILEEVQQLEPYATCVLFSGGKDSMAAYQVCKAQNVKIDYLIHINTRTGIQETTNFVRNFAESEGVTYIEGDAGTKYEDYVLRKGFFGTGSHAHSFAYHLLKQHVLASAISHNIRHGRRNRNILLINGARTDESSRRMLGCGSVPIRKDRTGVWVNVINDWTKDDRDDFLKECKAPVNPVTTKLCRSGECLCGTMQSKQTREEVGYFYPEWEMWMAGLEAKVRKKFPWGWGENMPKNYALEKAGQLNIFDQQLCTSCHYQIGGK